MQGGKGGSRGQSRGHLLLRRLLLRHLLLRRLLLRRLLLRRPQSRRVCKGLAAASKGRASRRVQVGGDACAEVCCVRLGCWVGCALCLLGVELGGLGGAGQVGSCQPTSICTHSRLHTCAPCD